MGAISDVTNFGDWTRAHGAGLGGVAITSVSPG